MFNRRNFIRTLGGTVGTFFLPTIVTAKNLSLPCSSTHLQSQLDFPNDFVHDEEFWGNIRLAYHTSPGLINLNNGGVSPSPRITQEAINDYYSLSNEAPSYYMWRILDQNREPLRENLAVLGGCSSEEITINRNTTEGLNTIILGLDLKRGDEVVTSKYDYPSAVHAWNQRQLREGIKVVKVDFPMPNENEDEITAAFVAAFTPKTKLVHITHVVNWNGQILPVRKIADEARKRGIEVLVDAAHSFALLDYRIPDLACDYLATSLHKWLCGPFGSGMLYIKKEKISKIWPLMAAEKHDSEDIRKFENLGTRSLPSEMAIGYSLDFHNSIGTLRKQHRLHFLKNYWMERVKEINGIHFSTSMNPKYACAIGTFSLKGKKNVDVANDLFKNYKIHVTTSEWEGISAVRVTPHIYTTLRDLDKLVKGIHEIAGK